MGKICETCPFQDKELDGAVAAWVWFDLLVEQGTFAAPNPESIEDRQYFFEGACRQAGTEIPIEEQADALLAVQAMMRCFRNRAEGGCSVERVSN